MAFNLQDYQTVQERIEIFWKLYPNGRIFNDIVATDDKQIIVKASVWKDANNQLPDTTDFAHEYVGKSGIGATSWVELASTSATGRALSLLGGELSPSKKRASQTEMEKAARSIGPKLVNEAEQAFEKRDLNELRELYTEAKENKVDPKLIQQILDLGQKLAKENAPAGKEQTTGAQADA